MRVSLTSVAVEHTVNVRAFTGWLERKGGSPREMADRTALVPFLDCTTLPAKVLPEKAEGIGAVILATLVVCILSGVILRIFLDGTRHVPLKNPYRASPVAGYPLFCPRGVDAGQSPAPQPVHRAAGR